jgi:hypothetical protein
MFTSLVGLEKGLGGVVVVATITEVDFEKKNVLECL